MKAYTDYPIIAFGDIPYTPAPLRECKIIGYDRDKYCTVELNGFIFSIKRGYLYKTKYTKECYSHEDLIKYYQAKDIKSQEQLGYVKFDILGIGLLK